MANEPRLDPPLALAESKALSDALLRGLNHGLANRLNALAMNMDLVLGGEPIDDELREMLNSEPRQVDALLTLYRLVPERPGVIEEPLLLTDVAHDAAALFHYHVDFPDAVVESAALADAPPAFGRRDECARVLCALVARAAAPRQVVSLRWEADGDAIRIIATGASGHATLHIASLAGVRRAERSGS
ncbi:MAG: hypothetical protein K2X99_04125 [Gemmatimonadaceae bacterium]|nr:hypothetical protein [Gemmatimonadaceae bacterium]